MCFPWDTKLHVGIIWEKLVILVFNNKMYDDSVVSTLCHPGLVCKCYCTIKKYDKVLQIIKLEMIIYNEYRIVLKNCKKITTCTLYEVIYIL